MGVITRDMAPKPALCRLTMMLRASALDVAISSAYPQHPAGLTFCSLAFQQGAPLLEAFEECVYENPLLLSEFAQTDLLIDSPRYLLVPSSAATDDLCYDMLQAVWPDTRDFQACPIPAADSSLAMAPTDGILAFARRTWLDTAPTHPLCPLAAYFSAHAESELQLFAWLTPGSVYCLLYQDEKLIAANSANAACTADAAYFMLATASAYAADHTATRYLLCGDSALCDEASALLRNMKCTAAPAPFPAQVAAADTHTPFPIIATIFNK